MAESCERRIAKHAGQEHSRHQRSGLWMEGSCRLTAMCCCLSREVEFIQKEDAERRRLEEAEKAHLSEIQGLQVRVKQMLFTLYSPLNFSASAVYKKKTPWRYPRNYSKYNPNFMIRNTPKVRISGQRVRGMSTTTSLESSIAAPFINTVKAVHHIVYHTPVLTITKDISVSLL